MIDPDGHVWHTAYDRYGNVTGRTDPLGHTTYRFDVVGELLAQVAPRGNVPPYNPANFATTYTYDLLGNTTTVTDPLGHRTTMVYDAMSDLTSATDALGHRTSYTYNLDGEQTQVTRADGTARQTGYDADGRMQSQTNPLKETTRYTYDPLGRVVAVTDPLGRTSAQSLTYDGAGQIRSVGNGKISTSFTYNGEGDRTLQAPNHGVATSYGYDQANRLVSYTRGSTAASYRYNGDGMRMSKTVGGVTSQFAWSALGGLPLVLSDASNSYLYGPGGQPIEQIASNGTVLYLHHDRQSTRLLTNSAGALAGMYSYDAYGNTTHTRTAATPLEYAGQYSDAESGLVYLRARYYDPQTAQFLTVDPLAAVTRTPCLYGGANPLNEEDATGLFNWGMASAVLGVAAWVVGGAATVIAAPEIAAAASVVAVGLGVASLVTGAAGLMQDLNGYASTLTITLDVVGVFGGVGGLLGTGFQIAHNLAGFSKASQLWGRMSQWGYGTTTAVTAVATASGATEPAPATASQASPSPSPMSSPIARPFPSPQSAGSNYPCPTPAGYQGTFSGDVWGVAGIRSYPADYGPGVDA